MQSKLCVISVYSRVMIMKHFLLMSSRVCLLSIPVITSKLGI